MTRITAVSLARTALREHLERFMDNPKARAEASRLVANFTAAIVSEDREKRKPSSEMAHLLDVFFNGRTAR